MSNDIERLLAAAADDTDQPLHTDIDAILARGRRSVRNSRIAAASTAALTTLAIVAAGTAWTNARHRSAEPANPPGITIQDGQVVEDGTGRIATQLPPVSPLDDAEVLKRCKTRDAYYFDQHADPNVMNLEDPKLTAVKLAAGPIDARWQLLLKIGDRKKVSAVYRSPDRSVVVACTTSVDGAFSIARATTTGVPAKNRHGEAEEIEAGYRVPVPGVTRVLVDDPDTKGQLRQARVGPDGYFGLPDFTGMLGMLGQVTAQRVRGYDASGRQVWEQIDRPKPQEVIGPDVKIKTAAPVIPRQVFSRDPESGRPLTVVPESPLGDDQVRAECKRPDDSFFDGPGFDLSPPPRKGDQRPYDAGRINGDWKVALKVGSGKQFTALIVSPGENVVAWCHRGEGSAYDYTRSPVQADGTFGDPTKESFTRWELVPDGVAQIIVDLPSGPVLARISNGYYLWGTTGGSEDFKKVRVRGFDADGRKVYDARFVVDAS